MVCKGGWHAPQAEVKHGSKMLSQWLSDHRQLFAAFFTNESQVLWLPREKQANLEAAQGKAESDGGERGKKRSE